MSLGEHVLRDWLSIAATLHDIQHRRRRCIKDPAVRQSLDGIIELERALVLHEACVATVELTVVLRARQRFRKFLNAIDRLATELAVTWLLHHLADELLELSNRYPLQRLVTLARGV